MIVNEGSILNVLLKHINVRVQCTLHTTPLPRPNIAGPILRGTPFRREFFVFNFLRMFKQILQKYVCVAAVNITHDAFEMNK